MRFAVALVALIVGCGGGETGEAKAPADDSSAPDTLAIDSSEPVVDAGTDAASDSATADAAVDAAPKPSCAALAACPATPSGLTEGNGLRALERCAFVLTEDATKPTAALAALEAALKKVTIADVLSDLNRTATPITSAALPGVPGFSRGFAWDDDDNGKEWWIPQGLTGTADANSDGTVAGKKAVIATWYYELAKHPGSTGEKGIRISVADVTASTVKYRHLLLVAPTMSGTRADFAAINIHAGGAAWVGDRLYVVDTGSGIGVFDLSRILEVSTAKDEIGWDGTTYQGGLYKYVVPQIAFMRDTSKCNPVFSFVALDKTAAKPSLITGEYVADAITGRLFHWPIDVASGVMETTTYASGAWVMGQRQVQGAVSQNGVFYLSSSKPAGGAGELYVTGPGKKTKTYPWVDAPEDLMFDAKAGLLWGSSEGLNERYVFAVRASSLTAP